MVKKQKIILHWDSFGLSLYKKSVDRCVFAQICNKYLGKGLKSTKGLIYLALGDLKDETPQI